MNWDYEDGRIYSVGENDELMAEATFVFKKNGEVDIDHTYVNPVLRGQGVAGKMMEVVAEYLKGEGLRASASCSFANAWLQKNRERYTDIISKDLDCDAAACKIDGKR
ncbi:MAG TPA: GNAT family N-acetyltransferase [Oscillospiraceae bacterium]|nr:GNAT family N-acetyltransferase [Oscillospiraceae bacterium]HPF56286.1 GNAT family N-acetyltransferase [Clostridiales bacterium]HPK35744.1 GNAT family N-acetyltransferase [Oscillospiraceae bacterium]HPR75048.1 GNAT family N-acetyltransferase [Oscillospiraceae bacterium]